MDVKDIVATEEAATGFFPTSERLVGKLLEGINWHTIKTVLEPSAGKGNIVDCLAKKHVSVHGTRGFGDGFGLLDIDCIEIDPYLRSIARYEYGGQRLHEIYDKLRELDKKKVFDYERNRYVLEDPDDRSEKGYLEAERDKRKALNFHMVHDDFLTFNSRKRYDLIIMNPPFSDGDAHLLKAIEIQSRFGGKIRCLLNAETLLNPYTNRRKLLKSKLEELGAEISFQDGAFSSAERRTDVSVAVVKVDIPMKKHKSEIYERLSKATELDDAPMQSVTDMAVTDFIQNIVAHFNVEVDTGLALIQEYNATIPYILKEMGSQKFNGPIMRLTIGDRQYGDSPDVNEYIKMTRMKYWQALFSNKELMAKLTSNLQEKYAGMVNKLADYDFSLFNIQQIIEEMNAEISTGIQETILALFDRMTEKHSWYPEMEKNIHYYSGWKTNKVHKINSKVILPIYGVFANASWSRETFDVYHAESTISDIEEAFDYLDGNETAKGTMHIKFRKQDLVDRFNIYCCRKKNWLPPSYGHRPYNNMDPEERAVVDESRARHRMRR